MPSTTNIEEDEIVDALGSDGNASMPEQVNRPNPRRKMMMMMICDISYVGQVTLQLNESGKYFKTIKYS